MASCSPVLAPEGTAARPTAPPAKITSASTVGFPRESRICRAWISTMVLIRLVLLSLLELEGCFAGRNHLSSVVNAAHDRSGLVAVNRERHGDAPGLLCAWTRRVRAVKHTFKRNPDGRV